MAKADHTFRGPADAQDSFAALAAAVSPAWHQAIIRLANAAERVCEKLGWVLEHEQDNNPDSFYVTNCRELVDMMLEFLDGIEEDPDLEPTLGFMNGPPEMDECEVPEDAEPSLGSFDRMVDQEKAWKQVSSWGVDYEQDDCDREDDDPAEESEASGIGDWDGLMEQIGSPNWQGPRGGMV
jgi:hypothetical protein